VNGKIDSYFEGAKKKLEEKKISKKNKELILSFLDRLGA